MDSNFKKRNKSHHHRMSMEKYLVGPRPIGQLLDAPPREDGNVIYFHIPYCSKICTFCNMRRTLSTDTTDYYKLLLKHMELVANTNYGKAVTIDSVYFGGGTPTSMSERDLALVLDGLYKNFKVLDTAEISMETTLNELEPKKLKALSKHGLNRISVGVQTFNDEGRKLMGRKGSGEFAVNRISEYLDLGFKDVNIDLIYNYPYQTKEILYEDMKIIKNLDLAGFSMYSLILNEKSQIRRLIDDKAFEELQDINRDYQFYNIVVNEARSAGYEFFELTKMVKPGRDEYKYIVHRNAGKDTIPIGAGAGGSINGGGIMNDISIEKYSKYLDNYYNQMAMVLNEDYHRRMKFLKTLQFGYIDLKDQSSEFKKATDLYFKDLEKDGYVYSDDEKYILTDIGRYWGNNINEEFNEIILDL